MDKIRQLFEETKGLDSIAKMYKEGKKEIYMLENEIEALKQEKNSLNLSEINSKIEECESKLNAICKEVDCNKIMENKCISLSELEKALDMIIDENVCMEKCLNFMNSLVIVFNISDRQLEHIFGSIRPGTCFKVIKINKEIEELFNMSKSRAIYKNLEAEFKSRTNQELEGAVPLDVDVFITNDAFYIVFPTKDTETDEISVGMVKKESFHSLNETLPISFGCVMFLLRTNLSSHFITECYTKAELLANNEKLVSTKFYISNLEEWTLDIVMKDAVQIPKSKIRTEDLHPMDDEISGKYVSKPYFRLVTLNKFITESTSDRKEKAQLFYDKVVLKFFDMGRIHSPDDLFIMYSDLSHYCKKYPDFGYFDELSKTNEDLLYQIINLSTNVDLGLNQSILHLKAKIKQIQINFNENIENFIAVKMRKFFKIQFFEKLYDKFLAWVLRSQELSSDEINIMKELAQYILDISFEIGSESIPNYCKISSLAECLDSSMDEIVDLYEFGGISLENSELEMLVRIMFPDSAARNDLINRLR